MIFTEKNQYFLPLVLYMYTKYKNRNFLFMSYLHTLPSYIERVVGGAGGGSHTSKLGTYFLRPIVTFLD